MLVVPCGLDRVPADSGGGTAQGYYGSLLPAVWSFMLAARSRGLGTAWTTLHLGFEAEAGALLGIPDTVTQLALVPVAYYTGDDFKPADRRAGRRDPLLERVAPPRRVRSPTATCWFIRVIEYRA